jgi:DNA polymerase III subunit delta'
MTNPPSMALPWLQPSWHALALFSDEQRLPQALLLTGQEGIGVGEFARAFVSYLLCVVPNAGRACGRCRGCQLLAAQNHPDIFALRPEEQSSVIKVQQIRELSEFMSNTAQQGGRKVILIEPADAMNMQAANALLKNLEEPIGQTFFVLASVNPSRLLATIKSRCHRVPLPSPSRDQALAWLEAQSIPDPARLLQQTRGAPLLVLEWLENQYFDKSQQLAQQLLGFLLGQNSFASVIKPLTLLGVPLVLERMQHWVLQACRAAYAPDPSTEDLVLRLQSLDNKTLSQFYDNLRHKKRLWLSGNNLNSTLVLEELLIELGSLFKMA